MVTYSLYVILKLIIKIISKFFSASVKLHGILLRQRPNGVEQGVAQPAVLDAIEAHRKCAKSHVNLAAPAEVDAQISVLGQRPRAAA